jgi:hypothetical protein
MDDHLIFEIDNVLSPQSCKEIIEMFEKSPDKKQSLIFNPINNHSIFDLNRRNSLELFISCRDEWSNINKKLSSSLKDCLNIYHGELCKKIKMVDEDPNFLGSMMLRNYQLKDDGYDIIRVNKNSEYRWHHDEDYGKNILRCIWYLNDMSESNGGKTMFLNGRVIKPKVGKVVIFPSTWIHAHCGTKVFNVNKYIITTNISII